jgi:hypothetical protein
VREDYSADGDAWSRKHLFTYSGNVENHSDTLQISLMNMHDRELSDGEKMVLLEFPIHMVCKTSHLRSGTSKSKASVIMMTPADTDQHSQ